MELITDYAVLFILFISFLLGFLSGFFKTALGPLSIVLGWLAGIAIYYRTDQLIVSLAVSIAIPVVIKILFFLFFRPKKKRKNAVRKFYLFGRLTGGAFNLFWYGSITALLLIIITLIPIEKSWYKTISDNIIQSTSYALIDRVAGNKIKEFSSKNSNMFEVFQDDEKKEKVKDSSEFKEIMEHKKIKALFKDEDSVKQLEDKDIVSLMSNPKIMEIIQDNDLVKKFLSLNKNMMGVKDETKGNKVESGEIIVEGSEEEIPADPIK